MGKRDGMLELGLGGGGGDCNSKTFISYSYYHHKPLVLPAKTKRTVSAIAC